MDENNASTLPRYGEQVEAQFQEAASNLDEILERIDITVQEIKDDKLTMEQLCDISHRLPATAKRALIHNRIKETLYEIVQKWHDMGVAMIRANIDEKHRSITPHELFGVTAMTHVVYLASKEGDDRLSDAVEHLSHDLHIAQVRDIFTHQSREWQYQCLLALWIEREKERYVRTNAAYAQIFFTDEEFRDIRSRLGMDMNMGMNEGMNNDMNAHAHESRKTE